MDQHVSLKIDDLHKSYGAVTVLHGISITANRGEFISLVGPSGCGKTTTLNIVAGFEEPDKGHVLINGTSMVGKAPHERGLGMVFQSHALFPHMTIAENVGFGLLMQRVPRSQIAERVTKALDLVSLGAFADRYPRQLSGGQQQRVGIARALTVRPQVILMDEPLSSLDAKLRREMQIELRRIQQEVGITALYVTHDQEEALTMSDRIVLMNKGRIEQAGSPEDVYASPVSEFAAAFIGEASFLNATIAQISGDSVAVALGNGTRLHVRRQPWMRDGAALRIAVRPDRAQIAAKTDGADSLTGTVVARAYMGPVLRYVVRIGSREEVQVEATTDAADIRQIGDEVSIAIDAKNWMTFSVEMP